MVVGQHSRGFYRQDGCVSLAHAVILIPRSLPLKGNSTIGSFQWPPPGPVGPHVLTHQVSGEDVC